MKVSSHPGQMVDLAAAPAMLLLLGLTSVFAPVMGLEQGLMDPHHLFDGFGSNTVISIIAVMIIGTELDKTGIAEVVVPPGPSLIGKSAREVWMRKRYLRAVDGGATQRLQKILHEGEGLRDLALQAGDIISSCRMMVHMLN